MTDHRYTLRPAVWEQDAAALRRIRDEVFVHEQHVPPELEWDGLDETCLHVLAIAGDQPIGTARMLPDGHIGRMAVRRPWRGRGVGGALLSYLLECARAQGLSEVRLNAQIHAIPFYERFGFNAHGEPFLDAGIPHRRMTRRL